MLHFLKPPSFDKDNPESNSAWNSVLNKYFCCTIQHLSEIRNVWKDKFVKDENDYEKDYASPANTQPADSLV